VREQIDYKRQIGVEFETDVVVGRAVTIDELLEEEGYDAVYIGTGAGLPQFMNTPGGASERSLFGERIPDPHQSDEGLQIPRVRRADARPASAAVIRRSTRFARRCGWERARHM
jgi:hypothetical protein